MNNNRFVIQQVDTEECAEYYDVSYNAICAYDIEAMKELLNISRPIEESYKETLKQHPDFRMDLYCYSSGVALIRHIDELIFYGEVPEEILPEIREVVEFMNKLPVNSQKSRQKNVYQRESV